MSTKSYLAEAGSFTAIAGDPFFRDRTQFFSDIQFPVFPPRCVVRAVRGRRRLRKLYAASRQQPRRAHPYGCRGLQQAVQTLPNLRRTNGALRAGDSRCRTDRTYQVRRRALYLCRRKHDLRGGRSGNGPARHTSGGRLRIPQTQEGRSVGSRTARHLRIPVQGNGRFGYRI